jgi:predicted transcriptional regulator
MKLTQKGVDLLRSLYNQDCKLYTLNNMLTCSGREVKQITQSIIDALMRNNMLEKTATEYKLTEKAKYFLKGGYLL